MEGRTVSALELLAWIGSMLAGPLSLGVIVASVITLLKVVLARRERIALDFLLPGAFILL